MGPPSASAAAPASVCFPHNRRLLLMPKSAKRGLGCPHTWRLSYRRRWPTSHPSRPGGVSPPEYNLAPKRTARPLHAWQGSESHRLLLRQRLLLCAFPIIAACCSCRSQRREEINEGHHSADGSLEPGWLRNRTHTRIH